MLTVEGLHRQGLGQFELGPLSFQIDDGECLALTGPSGAGKSLLLRALADLDPNAGQVSVAGRASADMPAPEWRRLVRYVPAESGWWNDVVGANISDCHGAIEMLDALGFAAPEVMLSWPVERLSSGERQRLALARGLTGGARVLLLDEPTAALDLANCTLVEDLLQKHLKEGAAILLVSHDVGQIDRMAHRRLALINGKLVPAP